MAMVPQFETAEPFEPLLVGGLRYKAAHGGRGSGKSQFFAGQMVYECLAETTRAVCVREIQRSLEQSSKRLIEDKIAQLGVGHLFQIQKTHIGTPGGGVIIFEGMQNHTAESIKSLEGFRIAWVDEAHRLSKFSLGLLRPTIFRVPRSQMWFSWNPRSPDDPVDKLMRLDPPDGSEVAEVNYDDNPWFPMGLREEMEYDRRRDPDRYAHVWLGEYQSKSEARVFKNWRVEDFETPEGVVFYHGCDWGFANDPTVLVRCWIRGRELFVDREVWKVGCEIDRTPALFDSLDPDKPGDVRRWRTVADSSNPQAISYMRRHGYPKIGPAVKGPGSVQEGVEFLKGYDIVCHPTCRHVAEELSTYSYETDRVTEAVLPRLADAKNHTIDSLRYAVEGVRRKPQPPMWGFY